MACQSLMAIRRTRCPLQSGEGVESETSWHTIGPMGALVVRAPSILPEVENFGEMRQPDLTLVCRQDGGRPQGTKHVRPH